jgi:hypothetical protein
VADSSLPSLPVEKHHAVRTDTADFDGDGIIDAVTETEVSQLDTDGDGRVDTVVITQTTLVDSDGDGVSDVAHRSETVYVDLDGDGTPDIGRVVDVLAQDTTGDGELDSFTITEREGFIEDGEIVDPESVMPSEDRPAVVAIDTREDPSPA